MTGDGGFLALFEMMLVFGVVLAVLVREIIVTRRLVARDSQQGGAARTSEDPERSDHCNSRDNVT